MYPLYHYKSVVYTGWPQYQTISRQLYPDSKHETSFSLVDDDLSSSHYSIYDARLIDALLTHLAIRSCVPYFLVSLYIEQGDKVSYVSTQRVTKSSTYSNDKTGFDHLF